MCSTGEAREQRPKDWSVVVNLVEWGEVEGEEGEGVAGVAGRKVGVSGGLFGGLVVCECFLDGVLGAEVDEEEGEGYRSDHFWRARSSIAGEVSVRVNAVTASGSVAACGDEEKEEGKRLRRKGGRYCSVLFDASFSSFSPSSPSPPSLSPPPPPNRGCPNR